MTTSNAETATLAALAKTPLARQALEAAEAEQHAERRAALERLAAADRARAEAVAQAATPIPALREAHAEARRRLHSAAVALHAAECHASDLESAADAKCTALRAELERLGGAAIERLRVTLHVEDRIADSLDSYRQVSTPDAHGRPVYSPQVVDGGGARRRAQIEAMHRALDGLERDPEASPAAIERRVAALRGELEAGPTRPVWGPYTYARNLDRKSVQQTCREAIRRVLRR